MEWVEYMTSDADSPMANLRRQNGREKPWRLKYFGVGNESWGCGGNMRAGVLRRRVPPLQHLRQELRRSKPIYRIACGSNGEDYNWTEVHDERGRAAHERPVAPLLHAADRQLGRRRARPPSFDEDQWSRTLARTLRMDELITQARRRSWTSTTRRRRVGMIVDEWGTWYDVEPGTKPGFLYQQNTLRDALVAALNFHIFHKHADRITMANIAQTVNVLQAMILTDKEKMLLTPTYHVFEMFKVHQGGTFLPVELQSPDYAFGQGRSRW